MVEKKDIIVNVIGQSTGLDKVKADIAALQKNKNIEFNITAKVNTSDPLTRKLLSGSFIIKPELDLSGVAKLNQLVKSEVDKLRQNKIEVELRIGMGPEFDKNLKIMESTINERFIKISSDISNRLSAGINRGLKKSLEDVQAYYAQMNRQNTVFTRVAADRGGFPRGTSAISGTQVVGSYQYAIPTALVEQMAQRFNVVSGGGINPQDYKVITNAMRGIQPRKYNASSFLSPSVYAGGQILEKRILDKYLSDLDASANRAGISRNNDAILIERHQRYIEQLNFERREKEKAQALSKRLSAIGPYAPFPMSGSREVGINQVQAFLNTEADREAAINQYRINSAPYSAINAGAGRREIDLRREANAFRSAGFAPGKFTSITPVYIPTSMQGSLADIRANQIGQNLALINTAQGGKQVGINDVAKFLAQQERAEIAASERLAFGGAAPYTPASSKGNKFIPIGNAGAALARGRTFDLSRLGKSDTLIQLGFAGAFGGLPSLGGALIGGSIGGAAGAVTGSTVVQALNSIFFEPLKEAVHGLENDFKEAGLAFQRSILGIAAVGQANNEFIGANGEPLPIGAQLGLQQSRARQIQLAARQKLLPLGIAGQTEATFVQGIVSALSQRGLQGSPEQIAEISRLIGGAIQSQRPGLLENTQLLLRDIQDVLGGGPASSRTILSQLIRPSLGGIQNAKTTEQLLQALKGGGLEAFAQAAEGANNPVVVINKLSGAIDILKTKGGEKLLDTLTPALDKLFTTLSDEKTIQAAESLGTAIGNLSSAFISFNENFAKNSANFINGLTGKGTPFNLFSALSNSGIGFGLGGVPGAVAGLGVTGNITDIPNALADYFVNQPDLQKNEAIQRLLAERRKANSQQTSSAALNTAISSFGLGNDVEARRSGLEGLPSVRVEAINKSLDKILKPFSSLGPGLGAASRDEDVFGLLEGVTGENIKRIPDLDELAILLGEREKQKIAQARKERSYGILENTSEGKRLFAGEQLLQFTEDTNSLKKELARETRVVGLAEKVRKSGVTEEGLKSTEEEAKKGLTKAEEEFSNSFGIKAEALKNQLDKLNETIKNGPKPGTREYDNLQNQTNRLEKDRVYQELQKLKESPEFIAADNKRLAAKDKLEAATDEIKEFAAGMDKLSESAKTAAEKIKDLEQTIAKRQAEEPLLKLIDDLANISFKAEKKIRSLAGNTPESLNAIAENQRLTGTTILSKLPEALIEAQNGLATAQEDLLKAKTSGKDDAVKRAEDEVKRKQQIIGEIEKTRDETFRNLSQNLPEYIKSASAENRIELDLLRGLAGESRFSFGRREALGRERGFELELQRANATTPQSAEEARVLELAKRTNVQNIIDSFKGRLGANEEQQKKIDDARNNYLNGISEEVDKRRALNTQLEQSKAALQEFIEGTSLRDLERQSSLVGPTTSFYKQFGRLPRSTSTEAAAIAMAGPDSFQARSLQERLQEEQIAAGERGNDQAIKNEPTEQERLKNEVENNTNALKELTDAINHLSDAYTNALQESATFASGTGNPFGYREYKEPGKPESGPIGPGDKGYLPWEPFGGGGGEGGSGGGFGGGGPKSNPAVIDLNGMNPEGFKNPMPAAPAGYFNGVPDDIASAPGLPGSGIIGAVGLSGNSPFNNDKPYGSIFSAIDDLGRFGDNPLDYITKHDSPFASEYDIKTRKPIKYEGMSPATSTAIGTTASLTNAKSILNEKLDMDKKKGEGDKDLGAKLDKIIELLTSSNNDIEKKFGNALRQEFS